MTAVLNAFRRPVEPTSSPVGETYEKLYVTPGIAEAWLSKNIGNRRVKDAKVAGYARDMAAGRWQFTGETIVFDWNGILRDGQNRLLAVVASGKTIPFLVVRGVDPNSQNVMDCGAPRTAADALGFHGFKNGKDIAAVANVVTCWERGLYRHAMASPDSKGKLTNAEVVDLANARPELVEATAFASRMKRDLPVPVGALAVAYLRLTEIDADAAEGFFARISELMTTGKGDPVNTLIRRVGEYRDRREQIRPATALYFIFRSWNAYRSQENLLKLQLGSAERGWVKIPEPK